jgi:hypothetical protein
MADSAPVELPSLAELALAGLTLAEPELLAEWARQDSSEKAAQ